jgi:cysteinyl-tRNA synthetase
MSLFLTNTLTRKKEKFEPLNGTKVNLFVCGPTVYDYSHLGHAKTYIQFDFLARYLRYAGYDVFYLQNITNIDDKIIGRAKESNTDWRQLSEKFEKLYFEDMKRLNNVSVSEYARATDYMDQIIKQVKTLMEKGYAYKIEDGIYFEISKFKDYGKLSGRTKLEESDSVSRIDENSQKRGWNDFCLWKFSQPTSGQGKPDEPFWESELGKGRPGWHIEDTAITEKFFGPQYDIHGGSVDLIIPHHEAEIAQMESASGKKPLVKYWIHTGFLKVEGTKMSKSLHNFYTIGDVIQKGFDPLALRYLFLTSHYRDPINFTWESLASAQNALNNLREQVLAARSQTSRTALSDEKNTKREKFNDQFQEALDDDLNTPKALAVLWSAMKSNIPSEDRYDLAISFDEVLGLRLSEVHEQKVVVPQKVAELVAKREELRRNKMFSQSDKVRQEIEKEGFKVEDSSKGPIVKPI